MSNPDFFREQVRLGALRWLHSLDLKTNSSTLGIADREYWAWKTRDFANGTWQGGLAGLLSARMLLPFTDLQFSKVIEATLQGSRKIQRSNGSFEEAYPLESSYAVTALVAFDLAFCYYRAPALFTEQAKFSLREILQGALSFLRKTPETHGVIANHLATGLMAEHLAQPFLSGKPLEAERYHAFCQLQHPEEGWFPEYGGADPGYQTLLNHYLAAGHAALPLPAELVSAWKRSVSFTSHFSLPDGSYAGEVGSRGTSIVYPSGTLDPAGEDSDFFEWVRQAWSPSLHAVTPTSVDSGNFVPVFNAWALAWEQQQAAVGRLEKKPMWLGSNASSALAFQAARLFVWETPRAKVIFSTQTGALRRSILENEAWIDGSLTALSFMGKSTQNPPKIVRHDQSVVRYQLFSFPLNCPMNTPVRSIVLRLMGILLYPFPGLQRLFKKILAAVVMRQPKKATSTGIEIEIDLLSPELTIRQSGGAGWHRESFGFHHHMASANSFSPRAL